MLQLNSKNFESVEVYIRGEDKTITMPAQKGSALMEYLTKDSAGSHVMLTDTDGNIITVSKHEIKKIVPTYLSEDINLTEIEI